MKGDNKFRWLVGASLFVIFLEALSLSGFRFPDKIAVPFFLLVIIGIGHKTLYEGFLALIRLNWKSINMLMLIAVTGAFYLRRYEEAAVVIVLYTLAEQLEARGVIKSKSVLTNLVQKMPKLISIKGQLIPLPTKDVKIGDIMIIKPGEMVALDGEVVLGFSYIDESSMTGEPIPKDKMVGDIVFAGTLNKQGYLEVKVTKTAEESTVAKIQDLIFKAQKNRAHTQKFIEKFSQIYTPTVIILAFLWCTVPLLFEFGTFNQRFLESLTMIVIACPCALVISTPVSIYSALGFASSKGILIKGGKYLEDIGQIQAIAFDKTKTLTVGKPIVTDVVPYGSMTKEHLLSCAAGIENFSDHPLALSINEAAMKENMTPHEVENYQSFVGKGAQADCLICDDSHHCIGKLKFILEEHEVSPTILQDIDNLQQQGKTVIVISTHRNVEGLIALRDEIRPESVDLIKQLNQLNIASIMLTGDHITSAQVVANEIGIKQVKADLLPQDKAHAIEALLKIYKKVAMIGDGINDAPALALSTVGITMSQLGSDTAIEAASVIILNNHLTVLPQLILLGRKTLRIIKFNTVIAILIKIIFISLALFGLSHLVLAILADVGVTIFVILNSLRLMK